ncbi:MAG: nuclear transport factor 2 family protein [Gammaproteobacteria bacterium]|nr:nuclear transport factor 2 family protein [Gammaproteobacteria bacterium]NND36076.1 nuclear transport factor 2 family protein [Gammaproteobacteria bacterium]
MNAPQVQAFIERWHEIFERNDPQLIVPLFTDDVEFYSPAIFAPKRGKTEVFRILEVVFGIFDGYRVTHTWVRDNEVMFEFEAEVGKYTLQGIDRFVLGDDGRVTQMKVWIRPLTGLRELARRVSQTEIDRQLAGRSALFKALYRVQARGTAVRKALGDAFR